MNNNMKNNQTRNLLKSIIILAPLIILSCVNDINTANDSDNKKQYPVNLSAQVQQSPTRVTADEFETGDCIGLFMLNKPNELNEVRYVDNTKFTYSNDVGFVSDKPIFFSDENILTDFISYYPFQENAVKKGSTTIEVATNTNQVDRESYSQSDFLVAVSKGIAASDDLVYLTFRHKLSRIDLKIQPNNKYTEEILLSGNLTIKLKEIYTKATYDFSTDGISNLNTIDDITPNGEWEISEGMLMGQSAIVMPQEIPANHSFIDITLNGKSFAYELPEAFKLNSGEVNEMIFTLEAKNDEVKCVLNTRIEEWGEIKKHNITVPEVSSYIDITKINFAKSNIHKIINKGQPIAEIVKEYLLSGSISAQAIVIYPISNGITDLQNGMILEILNESAKIHGGKISWSLDSNTFSYEEGTVEPIKLIYISEDGEILNSRPEKALQLQLKPDMLTDNRGNETRIYPLVKIGVQYWMRSDLKATKYNNGDDIALGTNFSTNLPQYCTYQGSYFFYNASAVATDMLAADGWRISNTSDWDILKEYIQNKTAFIKKEDAWKTDPKFSMNNLTEFNGVATGFFKNTYQSNNEHSVYWVTKVNNPNLIEKAVIISYNSNEINNGSTTNEIGASIRCLRNN
jgi:Fibrobacter succinogenes major domain (Fib_succ_major).